MTNPLRLGGPPRPFTMGDVGYMRLGRKLAAAVGPVTPVEPVLPPFEPTQLTGMILWTDASRQSSDGTFLTAPDYSSHGNDMVASANGLTADVAVRQNGLRTIRFTAGFANHQTFGADMQFGLTNDDGYSMFALVKPTSLNLTWFDELISPPATQSNEPYLFAASTNGGTGYSQFFLRILQPSRGVLAWGFRGDTSVAFPPKYFYTPAGDHWNQYAGTHPGNNAWWLVSAVKNGAGVTNSAAWVNGSATTPTAVGTGYNTKPATFSFASNGIFGNYNEVYQEGFFTGEIAELLAYDSAFTDVQRQSIEGYWAHKWALTSILPADHPYKVNPPTELP